MLRNPFCVASVREFMTAFFSLLSSSPSPIRGPTACMIALHGNLPAVVITASPTGTNPIFLLSFWIT